MTLMLRNSRDGSPTTSNRGLCAVLDRSTSGMVDASTVLALAATDFK